MGYVLCCCVALFPACFHPIPDHPPRITSLLLRAVYRLLEATIASISPLIATYYSEILAFEERTFRTERCELLAAGC